MGDEIGVDPIDNAGVDIGYLEQRWSLGVPGAAIDPNHVRHPPVAAVFHDDRHPSFDVEEHRILLRGSNAAGMINRHPTTASTAVLATADRFWQPVKFGSRLAWQANRHGVSAGVCK